MEQIKKKEFVKPELIKFDKPLDEVTLCHSGSGGSQVKYPRWGWKWW